MSKISTAAATNLLLMRNTFVAPGFLEPVARGSGKFNNLQSKMALEIEPTK